MNTGLCDVGYGPSGPARKRMFYYICYTGELCHLVQKLIHSFERLRHSSTVGYHFN